MVGLESGKRLMKVRREVSVTGWSSRGSASGNSYQRNIFLRYLSSASKTLQKAKELFEGQDYSFGRSGNTLKSYGAKLPHLY